MINSILSSSIFHIFNNVFNTNKEKDIIIDPMSCLIKLSILSFYDEGTKISVSNNKINFNEPCTYQGIFRYFQGDNREDLHNLYNPIMKCKNWYWNKDNEDMVFLFNTAKEGLKKLKTTYPENTIIQHTINYYIECIDKDNNNMINTNEDNVNEIHSFLKGLWSSNEINIIIQMLQEFNLKKKEMTNLNEVDLKFLNTINTITQTKEDELFSYIKKHSSVL